MDLIAMDTLIRIPAGLPCVLVQRFFTTQSGGGIGKPAHPNGVYKLAEPEHRRRLCFRDCY